jgi:hypothetical protein
VGVSDVYARFFVEAQLTLSLFVFGLLQMRRMYNALPPQGEALDDPVVSSTVRRRSVTSEAVFVPDENGIFDGAEDVGDSVSVRASPMDSSETD